jgi:hypothetical protein
MRSVPSGFGPKRHWICVASSLTNEGTRRECGNDSPAIVGRIGCRTAIIELSAAVSGREQTARLPRTTPVVPLPACPGRTAGIAVQVRLAKGQVLAQVVQCDTPDRG